MRALAAGELPEVPVVDRTDEIGAMAASVQVFKDNAIAMARLQQEQEASQGRAETEERTALQTMALTIETTTSGALDEIGRHSEVDGRDVG